MFFMFFSSVVFLFMFLLFLTRACILVWEACFVVSREVCVHFSDFAYPIVLTVNLGDF